MKKAALIFSVIVLITIFIGCSNNASSSDDLLACPVCGCMNDIKNDFCVACGCGIKASNGNPKIDFDEESDQALSGSAEGINFDLSEYKDHGSLACGLIWVQKTESTWDSAPQDYFAYFDANGNQESQWFSCDEYWPEDFQNDYVVLRGIKRAFEDNWDYHRCTVYNKSFSEIASLYCRTPALSPSYISDFNTQGYSFAAAYDESQKDEVLYWIDAQGAHIFETPTSSEAYSVAIGIDEYSLKKIKYSNDCFVLVDGSSDPHYLYTSIAQIYDKKGRFILDLAYQMRKHTEEFAITSAEVLEGNMVEFCFYGMDRKQYICVMNFNGDIIKSPVLKSEYIRDLEKTGQNDINNSEPLNTSTGEDHTANKNTVVRPASALEILETIWDSYAEEDKFFAMGGDTNNMVDNGPGEYALEDEGITATLLVPKDQIMYIDEAASLVHGMMLNNFTCGVFRIAGDPIEFVDAMYNAIATNRWICGMPEQLIVAVIGGEYVLACFGINDAIGPFKAAFIAAYPTAEIKYNEGIKG